ncbi:MAG: phosphate acetyltransferase [Omnitrophica WOR_2 bacterium RIFCSPLOWO2_12_FULL_51_8]|nr:MAG: phosphate acetyltransferase [Omnitrophica WOR_2 bacterium RIFCSPLOWO2_12_FULL_51_8]
MNTIEKIRRKAKGRQKTIVLPEYYDERVVEAARILKEEGIARPLLLTREMIDPEEKERYIEEFYEIHKARDMELEEVRKLFAGTLYYAAMMTREGKVDGLVAGAAHTTPDMARASIRCLGVDEHITIVSSCFIMVVPDCLYGDEGTFVFADCGIIPEPNSRQLACIALSAAELTAKVLGLTPRIALLSYSTKGSAKGRSLEKIAEAIGLLKEMSPGLLVDGELQVDAAIVPEVARIKYPDSPVGGKANVLIFPDLDAGNIGYKLVQRLSNARAVGPLLLGLKKPASDLSRGCLAEDVVDCAAVTAIRAE